jgi:hypothetical protein
MGWHLWPERRHCELTGVLEVPDEIKAAIADAPNVKLGAQQTAFWEITPVKSWSRQLGR